MYLIAMQAGVGNSLKSTDTSPHASKLLPSHAKLSISGILQHILLAAVCTLMLWVC